MRPGFDREDLRPRYDVSSVVEDDWHAYCEDKTSDILTRHLSEATLSGRWLLNAGSGAREISVKGWIEVALDLFEAPVRHRQYGTCGNIENLPFKTGSFDAVACVGEALGYCDPARAIAEFSRVLKPAGLVICDFASSRSVRHWLRPTYRRAADMIVVPYNGRSERTWVYDPSYLASVLASRGFRIVAEFDTHIWSTVAERFGLPVSTAVAIERRLSRLPVLKKFADLVTFVAVKD